MRIAYLSILLLSNAFCYGQSGYQSIAGFDFLEVVKPGELSERPIPVIIGFHYSSSDPSYAVTDYDEISSPVRLILPKGNFQKRDGWSYFPTDYYTKDSVSQVAISRKTLDSIAVFVKAIGEKYKTKPLVAGFSQGGDLSLLLAIYYPEIIRAGFPLAGFLHRQRWEDAKKNAQKDVGIYIYQGDADKIVSAQYTQAQVKELGQFFNIHLNLYPGLGHDFNAQMKKDYAKLMEKILNR